MAKNFPTTDYDLKLIEAVKTTGDNEAMVDLIASHSGVYQTVLDSSLSSDYEVFKQELREDKDYYMFRWALDYDPEKNMKYPVYVGQRVKWMCMNIVNRSRPWESLDEGSFDCSYEQQIEDIEEKALNEIKDLAKLYPDKRIETVITARYFSGRKPVPWKKLARRMKSSQTSLMNLHKKFLEWAKPKMKKFA